MYCLAPASQIRKHKGNENGGHSAPILYVCPIFLDKENNERSMLVKSASRDLITALIVDNRIRYARLFMFYPALEL